MLKILSFLLLIFGFLSSNAKAQAVFPEPQKFDISSKATGQEYEVFVSLPKSYSSTDTVKYPVLYVMDGNFMFPVVSSYQYLLSEIQQTQEIIVVGIGYHTNSILASTEFRTPDYTPTVDKEFETMLTNELKMNVRTGGADKFIAALKQEIFPAIERKFKTRERGFAGHSFGSLFGSYVLFKEPALFQKYILSSVSLFWDKEMILKQEESFFNGGNKILNAQVFITVGEDEKFMGMIELMQKLNKNIKSHSYKGLTWEERILPNENHASAFLTSFNQGLRALYARKM